MSKVIRIIDEHSSALNCDSILAITDCDELVIGSGLTVGMSVESGHDLYVEPFDGFEAWSDLLEDRNDQDMPRSLCELFA